MEEMDGTVCKVHEVLLVFKVMLVPTVLPEVSEMWVCQVMTELTVKRDLRVTVAAMVRPDRWVHPAHVVQQGMLEETVTSVWMARLDLKEVLAQTDLQVLRGMLVRLVLREWLVLRVFLVLLGLLVMLVMMVDEVLWDQAGIVELLGSEGQQVCPVPMEKMVMLV